MGISKKQLQKLNNSKQMKVLNNAVNEVLTKKYPFQRRKGTQTYYIKGALGNKKVCYTRQKAFYGRRFGFWSWIQTKYKNGTTKRTKFALSVSKKKAELRAIRLIEGLR